MKLSSFPRKWLQLGLVAMLAICSAGRAWAQPDASLKATYGEVKLEAGFVPDPFVKDLTAGGPLKTNLGGANAYVAKAPDFKLYYTKGSWPLTFHVKSDADTTLLINLPDGKWIANDDGPNNGLNPLIHLPQPQSGRYDIYVGTFGPNTAAAKLHITELPVGKSQVVSTAAPDISLNPTAGEVTLKSGYLPDPYVKDVTAGGELKTDLGKVNAHVTKAPTFKLNYTKGTFPLTIHVKADADTTLLINLPNGQWIANDDGLNNGLNPLINLPQPESGRYDIYVGTYLGKNAAAKLYITELPVENKVVVTAPTGKRPFFIIGHHANTLEQVNAYVAQGANFIECDIHNYTRPAQWYNGNGTDQIYVMHFLKDEFTRKYTNSNGVDAYFANIKAKMDQGLICGIELDIKSTLVSDGPIHYSKSYPNPRDYGRRVANVMQRHGIPANRVIMGVDEKTYDSVLENIAKVAPSGSQWAAIWADEFMKGVRWDAKYDCLLDMYVAPSAGADWADRINAKSDVGSLGRDQSVRGDFGGYRGDLQQLVGRRNLKNRDLRFVYFWTVDTDKDMRNTLDENVDGMITNEPARLKAILQEPKYQALYRIADKNDYPVPLADRVKRSLEDPFIYIRFENAGWYDTRFSVEWTGTDGYRVWNSGKCMLNQSDTCAVPRNVGQIRINGTWSNGSSYKAWKGYPITINGGANAVFRTDGDLVRGQFKRVQ